MSNNFFEFKRFKVVQDRCAMKVGTDGTLLGAWADGGKRILDIGTGTGLVALMMAQRFADAIVSAVDIDHEACCQAASNFASSPFSDRLTVEEGAVQEYAIFHAAADNGNKFDAIVCNPPYFVDSLKCPDEQRSVARHAMGLRFDELFRSVSALLVEGGTFSAIVPSEVLDLFDGCGRIEGFRCVRKCAVKTVPRKMPRRYLLAYSKDMNREYEETVECIDNGCGGRSEWYSSLTADFYIK